MNSRLDRWLEAIKTHGGDAVVIHDGHRPAVLRDGDKVEIEDRALTRLEMDAVLEALLPAAERTRLEREGAASHSFRYGSSADEVSALVLATGPDRWLELRITATEQTTDDAPVRRCEVYGWLEAASAARASSLLVSPGAPIFIRVNGALRTLAESATVDSTRVQQALHEFVHLEGASPESGARIRTELPRVGLVDCCLTRDRRGIGIVCFLPSRVPTIRDIRVPEPLADLCRVADGLVVLSGPREYTSPVLHGLVDLINGERASHVVMLERHASATHESRRAFISQRDIECDEPEPWQRGLRAAVDEGADVITIEGIDRPELLRSVFRALDDNRLIIGTCAAPSAVDALQSLCGGTEPSTRLQVAEHLAAISSGRRIRTRSGEFKSVNELLIANPIVRSAIEEAAFVNVRLMLERGDYDMHSLTAGLVKLVTAGEIDVREAYRAAPDPVGLASALTAGRRRTAESSRTESGETVDLSDAFDLLPKACNTRNTRKAALAG